MAISSVQDLNLKTIKQIANELFELGYYNFDTVKYATNLSEPIFLKDDFDEQFYWDMTYFLYKNHYAKKHNGFTAKSFLISKSRI